jgi:hypothetical protein
MKKGLAKAISLVLAVSMAMPGTAMAAAAQAPEEAIVEEVQEEAGVEEPTATDETAEEAAALTDESAEVGASVEEETPASEGNMKMDVCLISAFSCLDLLCFSFIVPFLNFPPFCGWSEVV